MDIQKDQIKDNLMINDVGFATASLSVLINAMAMGFIGVGITFYLLLKRH